MLKDHSMIETTHAGHHYPQSGNKLYTGMRYFVFETSRFVNETEFHSHISSFVITQLFARYVRVGGLANSRNKNGELAYPGNNICMQFHT